MEQLATKYNFKEIEKDIYESWERNNFFHAAINPAKEPFSIVIPPPNVTGILHMGHALNNTIQDILIRYKKMCGFESLWMPGTDHAGIATQNVVEKKIGKEGLSRQRLGREKFLERVWKWKQEYGSTIIRQLKRLGCACDWQRTRFTMDDDYSDAVLEVFIRLYEKGLIYRGHYIINWCPRCQTALSDEEAPHKDVQGFLYYIKYPLKNSQEFITVATTRPETMLGDTAVAVNPKDTRFSKLIGKKVILPLLEREIKVICDDFVDPEFGTGAVKVTPAHDPNDYLIGKRHNLEFINILHPDGRCNENAGDYADSDRFQAREAIIEDLKERKLLLKVEPHQHAVGHCYRCHTVIEPYYSKQWFVKMKPLSLPAVKAVKEGRIKFYPQRWTKVYLNWMEDIHDWCISRQIWWGHRLPVYYCKHCIDAESHTADSKSQITDRGVIVSREKPEKCPECGSCDIVQDNDVLDTWFSSWLWPFATFGWPFNQTSDNGQQTTDLKKKELEYFYPTSVLVTAPEIIFFWVARMIMAGFEFIGDIPFKDVYIHGTVRDDLGKKMSKSLGNSIDPLQIIDEYGADALRFSLVSITATGQDVYLSKDKFEFGRNFANKVWNASRFILMNSEPGVGRIPKAEGLSLADAWILSRFNTSLQKMNKALSLYRFNEAAVIIHEFFWHQFCDWYIELAKLNIKNKNTHAVLFTVLEKSLRLLHPFMPLITDTIWRYVTGSRRSIMEQSWPDVDTNLINDGLEREMERLIADITLVRNLRSETKIRPKEKVDIAIFEEDANVREFMKRHKSYLQKLAKISTIDFLNENTVPEGVSASGIAKSSIVYVMGKDIDRSAEVARIDKQIADLKKRIGRKGILLNNEDYLKKAPPEVVEKERQSLRALTQEMEKLRELKDAF